MNIIKKIEEIRQQPEHIRMRWVWGCVAVAMFFVVALWIFSVAAMFSRIEDNPEPSDTMPDFAQQLKDLKENAPSLEDLDQPLGGESSEGIRMPENKDAGAGLDEGNLEIPESGSYSNLGQ